MVATTFSSDTPNLVPTSSARRSGRQLAVVGLHPDRGIHGIFLRAPLAALGLLTDLEFYELRYSGKAAGAVRGFARCTWACFQLHHHGEREPGGVQDRRHPVRSGALADAAGGGIAHVIFATYSGLWECW